MTYSVVLGVVAATIVAAGHFEGGRDAARFAPLGAALAALLAVVFAFGIPVRGRFSRTALIGTSASAGLGGWGAATALWSSQPGVAIEQGGLALSYAAVVVLAIVLSRSRTAAHTAITVTVLGSGVLAAAALAAALEAPAEFFRGGRLLGPAGYFNAQAALLLVAFWPGVVLAALRERHVLVRASAAAAITTCLPVVVMTQSRGALLGLAVAGACYLALSPQRLRACLALLAPASVLAICWPQLAAVYQSAHTGDGMVDGSLLPPLATTIGLGAGAAFIAVAVWAVLDRHVELPERAVRAAGAAALVTVAAVSLLAVTARGDEAARQLQWAAHELENPGAAVIDESADETRLSSIATGSSTARVYQWHIAWQVFREQPVTGAGVGAFETENYQRRDNTADRFLRQPHNLTLELLSEQGIVGLALFSIFIGGVALRALQVRFRSDASRETKALVVALSAAIVGWLTHAQLDWLWQIPALTMIVMLFAGLVLGAPWRLGSNQPLGARRFVGAGLGVVMLALLVPLYMADRLIHESQRYAISDPAHAVGLLQLAERLAPMSPVVQQQLANRAEGARDLALAERAIERQVELNAEHWAAHLFAADFYARHARPGKAREHRLEAARLNPQEPSLQQAAEAGAFHGS